MHRISLLAIIPRDPLGNVSFPSPITLVSTELEVLISQERNNSTTGHNNIFTETEAIIAAWSFGVSYVSRLADKENRYHAGEGKINSDYQEELDSLLHNQNGEEILGSY